MERLILLLEKYISIHLHWWTEVRDTGLHSYRVCRCSAHKIIRYRMDGYQPIDRTWLKTGKWHVPTPPGRTWKYVRED